MTQELLWSMLGGTMLILHFLTDWTHHLQDQFATPAESVPKDCVERYLRGLVKCYAMGAVAAVALPLVPAGFAIVVLRSPSLSSQVADGLRLEAHAIGVLVVSIGYCLFNISAYWCVAPAVLRQRSAWQLFKSLLWSGWAARTDERLCVREE